MKNNHLINIAVFVALLLMITLTIMSTVETAKVAKASGESTYWYENVASPFCDSPPVDRSTIQRVYVAQMETWVTFIDGGPTGVDGGLIHLLSDAQACSKG